MHSLHCQTEFASVAESSVFLHLPAIAYSPSHHQHNINTAKKMTSNIGAIDSFEPAQMMKMKAYMDLVSY